MTSRESDTLRNGRPFIDAECIASAPITPGDVYLSVVPAGDGEGGDGKVWRVTCQHGTILHNGHVDIDDPKSLAEYVRGAAAKFLVDTDTVAWWLDRDIRAQAERYLANDATTTRGEQPTLPFTCMMTSAELLALDVHVDYLIDRVLVRGQPGVVGGRSKTLKTSVLVDLVVSLGAGKPFLGQFPSQQATVAFWSGESGAPTIRAKAQAAAAAKGITLADAGVYWSFSLPKLARADHLLAIADVIEKRKIDVAVIDPLYLSLLDASNAGQASNVFAMGAALQPLSELIGQTGCTILLCHHFRRHGADPDEPAALEELSQAGVGEWTRQWLLLARRSPYQADGCHQLWLRAGGSAGHAGLYALDADEGDPATFETGGRRWEVAIRSVDDVRSEARRAASDRKAEALAKREEDDRRRMLDALRKFPDGETKTTLRDESGLRDGRLDNALATLMRQELVERCEVFKNNRPEPAYRLSRK